MRFFIFVLLTFLAALITGINGQDASSVMDRFPNLANIVFNMADYHKVFLQQQRQKRAATTATTTTTASSTQVPSDTDCITRPLQQFQKDVKSNDSGLTNLTDSSGAYTSHQFYSSITEESLVKFCKLYIPRQKEITNCKTNSTLKAFVVDAFAIFDFICIERYNEFKKQLPCLKKVDPEITSKCTPNCSIDQPQGKKISSANITAFVGPKSNNSDVEEFTNFCKHLTCLLKCQTPIIKAECGKDAVKLIHDGVRVTFSKLNELNVATSSQAYWPKECYALASHNFNGTATSNSTRSGSGSGGKATRGSIKKFD